MGGRGLDQPVDQLLENLRVAIGEQPRRGLLVAAAARDHVGRDRVGRATEADQRLRRIERRAHPRNRLVDGRKLFEVDLIVQPAELRPGSHGIEPRPLALDEADLLAERVRDHEDVGEQDRGVEIEAPDRLERDLGRGFGRIAEIEEAARLGAKLAIFGKIASRLPHQPDRRRPEGFARKRFQETGPLRTRSAMAVNGLRHAAAHRANSQSES